MTNAETPAIMTHVNGVEIIERGPALFSDSNRPANVPAGTVFSTAEELLLADGTSVFHCTHRNAKGCEYTNISLNGMTSHQRAHSDRMVAKRVTAELEAAQAKEAARRANYAAGAAKGNETKKANRERGTRLDLSQAVADVELDKVEKTDGAHTQLPSKLRTSPAMSVPSEANHGRPGSGGKRSLVGDIDLAKQAQGVIRAYNAMQAAHDQFQAALLGYMRNAQLCTEQPAIDPQILAKAAQYDAIQAALKGIQ